LLGFGSSVGSVPVNLDGTIDLDDCPVGQINYAFTLPRQALLSSIAATFRTTVPTLVLPEETGALLGAQLFRVDQNQLVEIEDAEIIIGLLSGSVPANTTFSEAIQLDTPIEIQAGTQLVLAFFVLNEVGTRQASVSVTGYASAGIA
jgi:hypothetical protein